MIRKFGENYWVAIISLILYLIILGISIHQYYSISNRRYSKFKDCKLIFFGILGLSAALSLPLWGVCAIYGGPNDCQWKSSSYPLCWSLHLLALVGYASTIGIPTIMWSDIVNGVENQSFLKSFSTSRIDSTRICFVIFVTCYAVLELTTIISMTTNLSPSHMNEYFENNEIYKLSMLIEPFIICLFAGGCLFIGIRLQLYVRSVKFDQFTQRRLLFQLNGVLVIVAICYMLRSILIFTLRIKYISTNISYVAWIICTHWAPQVICSFCLLTIMSRSKGSDTSSSTPGKYYAYNNSTEGPLSPNHLTSSNQSSPLLHYDDDDDDEGDGDDEFANRHSLTDGDDYGSSQGDFFYNQEGTLQQNRPLSQTSNQRRPPSSPSSQEEGRSKKLQHDFSIFNPYVMTSSDDGNDSVISDDFHPVNLRPGKYDFVSPNFDM